jgi:hypothetical protein
MSLRLLLCSSATAFARFLLDGLLGSFEVERSGFLQSHVLFLPLDLFAKVLEQLRVLFFDRIRKSRQDLAIERLEQRIDEVHVGFTQEQALGQEDVRLRLQFQHAAWQSVPLP